MKPEFPPQPNDDSTAREGAGIAPIRTEAEEDAAVAGLLKHLLDTQGPNPDPDKPTPGGTSPQF